MANIFTLDEMDFQTYMDQTEAEHKVRSSGAFVEDVVDYFWGSGGNKGAALPWEKTGDLIRFRPGEVTLWSGLNGHGKSLVLGQMCMGFVTQRQKVCIASFEMKPAITLARICRQALGCNKPEEPLIREFHEITDPWIYLYDQQGTVKAENVLAVIRYCADKLGASHIVIDSFMKCGIAEDGPSAFDQQKDFMDKLCSVSKDTGIHTHIVAHSRKQRDEMTPPGKMDVKGSGTLTDQVDNVITVWRNKAKEQASREGKPTEAMDPDCILLCDKQRNGEWEGRIGLFFDPASLQYLEHPGDMSRSMVRG
jgi:twinkle protein